MYLQTEPPVGNNQLYKNSERGREGVSVGHMGNPQSGEGWGVGEGQQAGSRGISISGKVPSDAGSRLADFSSLKMEAIRSSETSVNPGSTQRHIPEDGFMTESGMTTELTADSSKNESHFTNGLLL
jgi:hypothetical protein